jgi:hypothetical protein
VNLDVASSHRPSGNGGIESVEPVFLRRRLQSPHCDNREDGVGSPAYQGRHAVKVVRSNTGGPYASIPDGKDGYKAMPKCHPRCVRKSEGREVLLEVEDNITSVEGSLPALVTVSTQGRIS